MAPLAGPRSLAEPLAGLAAVRRQSRGLARTGHRPWPPPSSPWIMGQSWEHVLFAHWPAPADVVRARVPAQLELEEFDGSAWVGVTPFEVRGLHPRLSPPAPVGSRFLELNTRTYVSAHGRPGIYFFSLDASSAVAVWGARLAYGLPYFRAAMSIDTRHGRVDYTSRRLSSDGAVLDVSYEPVGAPFNAAPGTLEHFLTERYRLYRVDGRGEVRHVDIHHGPWSLRSAQATFSANTMTAPLGFAVAEEAAHLLYSRRQDTLVWLPARTRGPARV